MKSYPIIEVARICAVTRCTAITWNKDGRFPTFRNERGFRRIWADDLYRFLREYRIPIPQDVKEEAEGLKSKVPGLKSKVIVPV